MPFEPQVRIRTLKISNLTFENCSTTRAAHTGVSIPLQCVLIFNVLVGLRRILVGAANWCAIFFATPSHPDRSTSSRGGCDVRACSELADGGMIEESAIPTHTHDGASMPQNTLDSPNAPGAKKLSHD